MLSFALEVSLYEQVINPELQGSSFLEVCEEWSPIPSIYISACPVYPDLHSEPDKNI